MLLRLFSLAPCLVVVHAGILVSLDRPTLGIFTVGNTYTICKVAYQQLSGIGSVKVTNTDTPGVAQFKCGTPDGGLETLETYQVDCPLDPAAGTGQYLRIGVTSDSNGFSTAYFITVNNIQGPKEIAAGQRDCLDGDGSLIYSAEPGSYNTIQAWATTAVDADKKNAVLVNFDFNVRDREEEGSYRISEPVNWYETFHTFFSLKSDKGLRTCGTAPADKAIRIYSATYVA